MRLRAAALTLVLLVAMSGVGLGTYHLLGMLKASTRVTAASPTKARSLLTLPGTVYVVQDGTIYRLRNGAFSAVTHGQTGWMQPSLTPDGRLVAVLREAQSSDLYLLGPDGSIVEQLTHDAAPPKAPIEANHWAFYPRVTADGSTVFFAYDSPKEGYRVDLAIWSRSLASGTMRRWTTPDPYTGGDIEPIPLANGGLLYVADTVDKNDRIVSQLMLLSPSGRQTALTTPEEDCTSPALSPDERTVAMVCRFAAPQTAVLEVASFDGTAVGPRHSLVADQLCASPAWAPDGSGLLYLAPAQVGSGFQLWWLSTSPAGKVQTPKQVTQGLDLDATSAPAWAPSGPLGARP